ncbi:MAG: hypothetical protein JNG89_13900 [Planctomycetaceae bacterium]|nr:hypothetical protein [Planctomycetaceae bacterium]
MSLFKKLTLAIAAAGMLAFTPLGSTSDNTARADYGYYGQRGWRGDGWRGRNWRGNWHRYRGYSPYSYRVYDPYAYYPAPYYQPYSFGYQPWYDIYRVPGVGRW